MPKRFGWYLITESLGAFNDNFFKMLIQLYVLNIIVRPDAESIIAQAAFIFTIPFVIFGPWSGWFSDRYAKVQVMRFLKIVEIIIMTLGVYSFVLGNVPMMMGILFLMASHSSFFAPAKVGYIPEACSPEMLSKANGWVNLTTFSSIILGTALVGPLLTAHKNHISQVAFYCVGIALFGFLSSLQIEKIKPSEAHQPFPWNPLSGMAADLVFLKRQKGLFLASLAISYFWLLGLIFQSNILIFGRKEVGLLATENTKLALLPAMIGIGIALGSLLASRWSGKKVELGLTPLGGLGLTFFSILLGTFSFSYPVVVTLLLMSGIFGGLFIVPLTAYLQSESKSDEKGRVLATAGVLNGLFLVLGSFIYQVFSVWLHLSSHHIFLVMGIMTFFVTIYICTVIPEYFVRFLTWLLTHTFYRIRIEGAERVPFQGPALLVPNHVSFIDALLISSTIQRFIKFIMWKKLYEIPGIHKICQLMDVIPVAPYEGRESVAWSLEEARKRLLAGDVVCIFPEGQITRHGELNEFKKGFETIMKGIDCPIIPVYLHNVWGSVFSFEGGKVFWKFPKKFPYPISVTYGKSLPANATAEEVQKAVVDLKQNQD